MPVSLPRCSCQKLCPSLHILVQVGPMGQGVLQSTDFAKSQSPVCFFSVQCKDGDVDDRALERLKGFPPETAVEILEQFKNSDLSKIRNRSAYLSGVMGRFRKWNDPEGGSGPSRDSSSGPARGDDNRNLPRMMQRRLDEIYQRRGLAPDTLDQRCLNALGSLPVNLADGALDQLDQQDLSQIRSIPAWFMSVIKRANQRAGDQRGGGGSDFHQHGNRGMGGPPGVGPGPPFSMGAGGPDRFMGPPRPPPPRNPPGGGAGGGGDFPFRGNMPHGGEFDMGPTDMMGPGMMGPGPGVSSGPICQPLYPFTLRITASCLPPFPSSQRFPPRMEPELCFFYQQLTPCQPTPLWHTVMQGFNGGMPGMPRMGAPGGGMGMGMMQPAAAANNHSMAQIALGVRVDEFHNLSMHAPMVHAAPALKLQQLWDEGCRLVSLLDDRAWEALAALGAPEALVVIDEVADNMMRNADNIRNINALFMVWPPTLSPCLPSSLTCRADAAASLLQPRWTVAQ